MLFKPRQLGRSGLPEQELTEDKKHCKKFGPCGVGKKALYLNSFYINRHYYVPISSVRRVFKRLAMSKGGFTGKGMFATIPYLVAEYEDGSQKQCNFKYEQDLDLLLDYLSKEQPQIALVSEAAEERIRKRKEEESRRPKPVLTEDAKQTIARLEKARSYLEDRRQLSIELSAAAKARRVYDRTNPAYKWVALAIVLMGAVSLGYGIWSIISHRGYSMYFLLFGMAAIFLFSGANVIPTARNNRRFIYTRMENAVSQLDNYIGHYRGRFPVPACYAHPVTLQRMIRIVENGKAQSESEALKEMMTELKSLNADVQVSEEEYEEVVAIKPLFLLEDYRLPSE